MANNTQLLNGVRVPLTAAEQAELDARLAAYAIESISLRREARRLEFRNEADRRIALITGPAQDQMRVIIRQVNTLARAVRQVRAEARGDATVSAELDALEIVLDQIQAVRDAENAASAALDAAGTDEQAPPAERIAAIEAITPIWP